MEERTTRSAGGIVLGDGGTIALVRNARASHWLFPKGHVDEGETDEDAARREIEEETGLTNLELLDDLGMFTRHRLNQDGSYDQSDLKEVHMYLFAAEPHAVLAPSMEIEEARWVSFWDMGSTLSNEKEKVWFASVAPRVRQAIQRD
jgi:8-oxo-dGTP pyrophosphatase MutT (NUDIX family)